MCQVHLRSGQVIWTDSKTGNMLRLLILESLEEDRVEDEERETRMKHHRGEAEKHLDLAKRALHPTSEDKLFGTTTEIVGD